MYIWLGLFDITHSMFMCVRVTYQSLWQTVRGRSAWVEGDSRLQQQLLTQRGDVGLCVCLQAKLQGVQVLLSTQNQRVQLG